VLRCSRLARVVLMSMLFGALAVLSTPAPTGTPFKAPTEKPSTAPTKEPTGLGCGDFDQNCLYITPQDVWGSTVGQNALRLVASAVVGAVVGMQREFGYILNRFLLKIRITEAQALGKRTTRQAGSGLQTHMLVAIGSCLFTLQSSQGFVKDLPYSVGNVVGDQSRIAAAVVTGVGFLGAGSIIKDGGVVKGLTSAASIWVTAALGMAAGTSSNDRKYLYNTMISLGVVVSTLQFLGIVEYSVHVKFQATTKDILDCTCVFELEKQQGSEGITPALISNRVDQIVAITTQQIGQVTSMSTAVSKTENGTLQLEHTMVTEVELTAESPSIKFVMAMECLPGFVKAATSLGSTRSSASSAGAEVDTYGTIPMTEDAPLRSQYNSSGQIVEDLSK